MKPIYYHRVGPGYNLSHAYAGAMHISVGWYGKEWGGDHAANEMNLRYYAIFQGEDSSARQRTTDRSELRTPKGGWIGWGGWTFVAHMGRLRDR